MPRFPTQRFSPRYSFNQWRYSEVVVEIVGWIGSVVGSIGAVLLALNIRASKYAYVLYFTSSLLMVIFAFATGEKQVLFQNAVFTIVNGIGLVRWGVLPGRTPAAQKQEVTEYV